MKKSRTVIAAAVVGISAVLTPITLVVGPAAKAVALSDAQEITTMVGPGTGGLGVVGIATSAELGQGPDAGAVDAWGNLVFGDWGSHRVRVVANSTGYFYGQSMTRGYIYNVAGNGTQAYSGDGGPATSAELDYPGQIALDARGNIVIPDFENSRIRVVASSTGTFYGQSMSRGDIYTVAGNGTLGFSGDGGPATSAALDKSEDVVIDKAGNLVIADLYNNRVRVVAASTGLFYGRSMTKGDIYTIAGSASFGYTGDGGPATSAEIEVGSLTLDEAGNVVIDDSNNSVLRLVAATSGTFYGQSMTVGDIYTIAGNGTTGNTGDGGPALSAELDTPTGVAVDGAGNLAVVQIHGYSVRIVAASNGTFYGQSMTKGDVYTVAGNGTFGYSGDGGAATSAQFKAPVGVSVDGSDDLIITDNNANVIRVVWSGATPVGTLTGIGLPPEGSDPGSDQGGGGGGAESSCPCSEGEPINPATGDFYDTETDLTIPGAGIPLTFNRTYDADAAQTEEATTASAGSLGYGWSENLGMSITSGGGTATVTQANGSQLTFEYYAPGVTEPVGSSGMTWCPSNATVGIWCPTAPRYVATLSGASGGTGGPWMFTNNLKSPITYSFTSGGALNQITDATGDTLIGASYSPGTGQASCPTGDTCVAWASVPAGESTPSATLVEAFNSGLQLVSVFDADSAAASTQIATFAYAGSGCSNWSGTPTDLCSVTDPGSLTTTFNYDTGQASPYQYDETTMSPPATGQVSNTYNSAGKIATQIINTGATNQEQDFSYTTSSTVAGDTQTAVMSYPDGSGGPSSTTTYYYSNGVQVAETNGNGVSTYVDPDPTTLLAEGTIDGNGNETQRDFDSYAAGGTAASSADVTEASDGAGNTTETQYTPANLPWCSVDAADYANGTTCPGTEPTSPPSPGTNLGYTLTVYNSQNQPTSVTDPLGNTTVDAYTSGVTGVPNGLLYCSVDPAEYAQSVSCPSYGATHVAGTTTKTFDANGDVLTSTDADGDTTAYSYGSPANPGLPTVTTDPDGKVTTDTYNAEGKVLTQVVTDTSGTYSATTQNAYDSAGRKWCEVSPFEYSNSIRCPTSIPTSPPTGTPGYTDTIYDANGQVISTTNPIGGTTQYAYDGSGNRYCTVSPTNYAASTRCPPSLPLTTPTVGSDFYLGATIDTFDADNQVVQVTNPLGGITLNTYDGAGNLTQTSVESNDSTDAPTEVTKTTYDADNRAISTTTGYGSSSPATTLTDYDPNGNAFCTVSANAYAAGSSAYQCPTWQAGWVTATPSPGSLYSTSPTSAQANNVTTTFDNADGTEVQTSNPDVQTSVTAVDADQRTYCTSDPTNVATWLTANPSGTYPYLCPSSPPTSAPTGTPDYTTTIYDAAGRTVSSTDQVGDTTSYAYDPAGNKTTVTDPRGKVTTSCYYWESGSGQCAHGAPAGGGSYDDLYSTKTPTTSADPSGQLTESTYYPGDKIDVATTPAGTSTDTYDANLDLTGTSYTTSDSTYTTPASLSFTYNPDGSRLTMTDGTGTTTYGYDAAGDVTSQALAATGPGLASKTVDYSYYTTGVLASTTYPSYTGHSSPAVNYAYDATGAMISDTDWLGNEVSFGHDADGNSTTQDNAVSTSNPSGTSSTAVSYDNADQPGQAASSLNCSGTNGLLTQSFSGLPRNADGQVAEYTDTYTGSCAGPASAERNYSYDAAGRVIYQGATVQGSSPNTFTYDASGDPTAMANHDSSLNFDTYSQAFDNTGEIQNQTVTGAHGVTTDYAQDTLGDETQANTASTDVSYAYNQAGQMAGYATSNNTTLHTTGTSYQYTGDGLEAGSTVLSSKTTNEAFSSSISCPTTSFCATVDLAGNASTYNGSTWTTPSSIASDPLDSVSCSSSTFCAAVDQAGKSYIFNGSTWTQKTMNDGTKEVEAVSCTSSTFCVAGDNDGDGMVYGGSSWVKTSAVDGTRQINSISCKSTTSCRAVDIDGGAVLYNGSTWTRTSIDGTQDLTSISCPTTSFCAAVDIAGNALIYSSGSWGSATQIDGGQRITAISCTSSSYCIAGDNSSNVVTFNGSSWSPPQATLSTWGVVGMSCPSSSSCYAAYLDGDVMNYGSANVTSQMTWDTNGQLPLVLSDSTNDYIYGPTGEPAEQINNSTSTPTYLSYSSSGGSWLATNNAGQQQAFWRYDAFGNLAKGTPDSPFGFAGQYADTTSANPSGLSNMRARWYEPQTGGFTTRDADFGQTDQAYVYAGDDPVNGSDPSGQSTETGLSRCGSGSTCLDVPSEFLPGCLPSSCIWNNNAPLSTCSTNPESGVAGTPYYFFNESQGAGLENLPLAPAALYQAAYYGNRAAQSLIYLDAVSQVNFDQQWSAEIANLDAIQSEIDKLQQSIDKLNQQLAALDQRTSLTGTLATISSIANVAVAGVACVSFAALGAAVTAPGIITTGAGIAGGCAVGIGLVESTTGGPSPSDTSGKE